MSLFRSRKKSFNDGDSSRRPSLDEAPPMPTGFRGRTFKKKKQQPEVKKEINIEAALPPRDDFRTSLLMPNLSARFSLLREQDNPNTKIGKANDDSVLFPNRLSRLNMFDGGDLADIAEVASITGSIKPPFASERSNSYSSADNAGYGTDDDGKSIMNRSRPGQGNKFFGGRQKVYMIPMGGSASMKDLGEGTGGGGTSSRMAGKAVYDDDINLAAFRAKEVTTAGLARSSEDQERPQGERRRSSQPSDYNSKRETSSSTNSGPFDSRGSTAATSVASQSASPMNGPSSGGFPLNKQTSFSITGQDRPTKGKRLYGQGLDQQIHDQQSSALNRLNSIQRNFGPGMVHYASVTQSRSATNLNDRFQKPTQLSSSGSVNPMSPILGSSNSLAGFDFGTQKERSRSNSRDNVGGTRSPAMSPPMSPTDPTLVAALEPNDLGKATASGAFNKPKTPYNEEQFAQRQLQLQEGRETPPPRAFSRTGTYNNITTRERQGSLASQRSGYSLRSQNQMHSVMRAPSSSSNLRSQNTPDLMEQATNGTYLASLSGSEYGSEPSSPDANIRTIPHAAFNNVLDPAMRHRKYEHDDQHPAFSSRLDLSEEDHNSEASQGLPLEATEEQPVLIGTIDSPTLPSTEDHPTGGLGSGLSDMIRGHLRNVSNQSSIYPNSPPRSSHGPPQDQQESFTGLQHEAESPSYPLTDGVPVEPLAIRARRLLENANQLKNAPTKPHDVLGGLGVDKVQQVLGGEAPRRSNETTRTPIAPWQDQLKGHARGASTETQKEREDFASELADRRKQVQNNLKKHVSESRSSSPNGFRTNDNSPARGGALSLLKKASKGSLVNRNENARLVAGADSRPFNASRSNDQLNIVGGGTGPSFRERTNGIEGRTNFSRKTSPSPTPGPERAMSAKAPSPNPNGYSFVRANADNLNNQHQMSYRPAGRARKYSPPNLVRPTEPASIGPASLKPVSASGTNSPVVKSPAMNGSYFPQMPSSSTSVNTMYPPAFVDSPRASPITPGFSAFATPPLEHPPTMTANGSIAKSASSTSLAGPAPRKKSINKEEISIPTFISGTSSIITVDLPPGASLANGMDEVRADAPPVPPLNPRRRKGQAAQNLFTSFGNNKSNNNLSAVSTPSSIQTTPNEKTPFLVEEEQEEKSTFSADESDHKPRQRNRLRKSSSVGDNMSQRARQQALKDLDKLPKSPNPTTAKAGMF
jgi:hypothetical protein